MKTVKKRTVHVFHTSPQCVDFVIKMIENKRRALVLGLQRFPIIDHNPSAGLVTTNSTHLHPTVTRSTVPHGLINRWNDSQSIVNDSPTRCVEQPRLFIAITYGRHITTDNLKARLLAHVILRHFEHAHMGISDWRE